MDTKDLGTYHVRIEFTNGDGFINKWETGLRYTNGSIDCSPLDAKLIPPAWANEEQLLNSMFYMFTQGNYSCDCNRLDFLDDAHQRPRQERDDICGHTLILKKLTAIKPDASEVILYDLSKDS